MIRFDENKINDITKLIPAIPYCELHLATAHWNKANGIGSGGFGTVFRGKWKNTDVAIKKLEYNGKTGDTKKNAQVSLRQSLNELKYLNSCRHDNIVPLYGFSIDGAEPCLVYQFMAGGSLEKRLHIKDPKDKKFLSLEQRNRIVLGTARGLQYLHTYIEGKPLIHGDIKPANILLDPCCVPKIGDFGLVREGSVEAMEVSTVYGTRPYLPKEFLANRTLSTKIDTYSYGVVLFEVYTGLRAYDKNRGGENGFLAKFMWSQFNNNQDMLLFIDQNLAKTINDGKTSAPAETPLFDSLMKIALVCTTDNSEHRPEMVNVLDRMDQFMKSDEEF